MGKIKKANNDMSFKDLEQLELSYIGDGSVKWYNIVENHLIAT